MDRVKKHFQDEAVDFDKMVVKSVPFYADMLGALTSAVPFKKDKDVRVVDLGCGTGTAAGKVKDRYPLAKITCVDFSDNMIKIAKDKLRKHEGIEYVVSDVLDFDFSGYDAVLSSLALHHVRDEEKKRKLYKKIFRGLNGGGVFYAADLVFGSSSYLQDLNLRKWGEFLQGSLSKKEMMDRKKRYHTEDHPFRLMDEIFWLKQAGFRDIDVVWKYYHFAVYGGEKR